MNYSTVLLVRRKWEIKCSRVGTILCRRWYTSIYLHVFFQVASAIIDDLQCTDADSDNNGNLTYSLTQNPGSEFSLVESGSTVSVNVTGMFMDILFCYINQ